MLWNLPCWKPWNTSYWKKNKKIHGLLEFVSYPPLGGGLDANSGRSCTLIHNLPCRTSCRLFIHELFFGPLGLHLLVWSELGRSLPFRPMRALTLPWLGAFSLVCKVVLQLSANAGTTHGNNWWKKKIMLFLIWIESLLQYLLLVPQGPAPFWIQVKWIEILQVLETATYIITVSCGTY